MCIKSSSRGAPPPRAPPRCAAVALHPRGGQAPCDPRARALRTLCLFARRISAGRARCAAPAAHAAAHVRKHACAPICTAKRWQTSHKARAPYPSPRGGGRLPLGYHAPSVEKSAKIKSATNKAIPPHPPRLWRWYVGALAPQLVRTALNYLHKPEAPRQWQLSLRL